MQNSTFVIDTNHRPLPPIHPGLARRLLSTGKAAVFRRYPFTIILKAEVIEPINADIEVKIDPGSKTTGIVLVKHNKVIWAGEIQHRGATIKANLESRRAIRHNRRARKTRYRPARFLNRTKPKGCLGQNGTCLEPKAAPSGLARSGPVRWLAPSLLHRVLTIDTWVKRLVKYVPVGSIAMELVRFDMQKMQNPEITGVEYQRGELAGYDVREYLLEKFGRKCAYCGAAQARQVPLLRQEAENTPLQVEHVQPKANGGSNRVSNLTLACHTCNQRKGTRSIEDFLAKKPEVLKRIKSQLKTSLKDAAAVNATRWRLFETLKTYSLPLTTGSGAQTKFNRSQQGYGKAHWIDAACVGEGGAAVEVDQLLQPLLIRATGHGTRQMCRTDKYGFPRLHKSSRAKSFFGFKTGDMVKAIVTAGKNQGTHAGRIAVRASGYFDIKTKHGKVGGVAHRYVKRVFQLDGYDYGM
jgi:5-methylcytosine-specific restriction endonuclease McrA